MLRNVLRCALCAALWVTAAAVSSAAISQEGGVSITPGTVQVGLSTPQSPTIPAGDGRLWITPPSTLAANTMIVGSPQGQTVASGAVFVQGGVVTLTEGMFVGRTAGNGSVAISDGGLVTANTVRIGGDTSTIPTMAPQGILTIDGPGSKLRYGFDFSVGSSSDGQLIIRNGGAATSQQATASQPAYIGRFAGSTGVATVDGAGSLWQHGGDLIVGGSGVGTLRITNGGVVTGNGGRVSSADGNLSSYGSVLIDGPGSRWSVNILDVGRFGSSANGEIIITNGGTLDQSNQGSKGTIGAAGYGRIVVSGPTSRWLHPGTPTIGGNGTGELFLDDGAQFTSAGVLMGLGEVGFGSSRIVVRGVTTRWTSTSPLNIGSSSIGQAAIELLDGATLNMAQGSSITIGAGGRLLLDRGRILMGSTRGAFTNSGLIQGGGSLVGTPFVNSGRIRVGAGERLQISGQVMHNPTGVIEINGGELEVGSFTSVAGSRVFAENATLRATGVQPGFASKGTVTFAHGRNRVFGPFTNSAAVVVAADAEAEFYDQVTSTGPAVMSVAAGGKVTMFSAFKGNGVGGAGDVYLEGLVQPGASPGVMNFGGDVHLGGASQLQIEIGGDAPIGPFDQLIAGGSVSLSGALQLTALSGIFGPNVMLPIVRAGELTGTFSSTPAIGANIGAGVRFHGITYDYNHDEVLVSLTQGLAADFNLDGAVSGADLLTWQLTLGSSCEPGVGADATCDGYVDGADLQVWSAGMAAAAASQSASQSAVPEPASLGLLVVGVFVFRGVGRLGVRRRSI